MTEQRSTGGAEGIFARMLRRWRERDEHRLDMYLSDGTGMVDVPLKIFAVADQPARTVTIKMPRWMAEANASEGREEVANDEGPAADILDLPDGCMLPEGYDYPRYEDMTREELIEACRAHDVHHAEHHQREDELKRQIVELAP